MSKPKKKFDHKEAKRVVVPVVIIVALVISLMSFVALVNPIVSVPIVTVLLFGGMYYLAGIGL